MPQPAIDHLARIPTIVLDPKVTHTSRLARVHITTAVTGISAPGTVYRMDEMPLPLRPALKSPYPTDEEVVRRIRAGGGEEAGVDAAARTGVSVAAASAIAGASRSRRRRTSDAMTEEVTLVDRGRAYAALDKPHHRRWTWCHTFRHGCSHEEIIRWMPSLTPERDRGRRSRTIAITRTNWTRQDRRVDRVSRRSNASSSACAFRHLKDTDEERHGRAAGTTSTTPSRKNGEGDPG